MIQDRESKVRATFQARSTAYNQVFLKDAPMVLEVLRDLAEFCRAHKTTFHPNPHVQAALEGRREVWLRIEESLQLSSEQIFKLHRVHLQPKGEI